MKNWLKFLKPLALVIFYIALFDILQGGFTRWFSFIPGSTTIEDQVDGHTIMRVPWKHYFGTIMAFIMLFFFDHHFREYRRLKKEDDKRPRSL